MYSDAEPSFLRDLLNDLTLGAIAHHQKVHGWDVARLENTYEIRSTFTRHEASYRGDHESIRGQSKHLTGRADTSRRTFDAQWYEVDLSVHPIDVLDVLQGIVRLANDAVRSSQEPAHRASQPRMQMRRARLTGIVEVAAMCGEDVGHDTL